MKRVISAPANSSGDGSHRGVSVPALDMIARSLSFVWISECTGRARPRPPGHSYIRSAAAAADGAAATDILAVSGCSSTARRVPRRVSDCLLYTSDAADEED